MMSHLKKAKVQPKREPIILQIQFPPILLTMMVSQANIEEKMADQIVNNNSSESSKNDLDMQKPI